MRWSYLSVVLSHRPGELIKMASFQQRNSPWWRHQMETFSALLAICAWNSPVPGEFPAQRPVTRSFDVFFDLCLNKRLSKQSWGWWFEMLSRPLWCHRNALWRQECQPNRMGHSQNLNLKWIWIDGWIVSQKKPQQLISTMRIPIPWTSGLYIETRPFFFLTFTNIHNHFWLADISIQCNVDLFVLIIKYVISQALSCFVFFIRRYFITTSRSYLCNVVSCDMKIIKRKIFTDICTSVY